MQGILRVTNVVASFSAERVDPCYDLGTFVIAIFPRPCFWHGWFKKGFKGEGAGTECFEFQLAKDCHG